MRAFELSTVGASRPCSAARRRSWANASAWKVPAVTPGPTPSRATRPLSSAAAGRVKVTARTWRDSASSSRTRHAIRRVSTLVFPEPAGARIASGAAVAVTASRWRASRSSSNASITATVPEGRDNCRERRRGQAPSSHRCVSSSELLGASPSPTLRSTATLASAPETVPARTCRLRPKSPATRVRSLVRPLPFLCLAALVRSPT